MPELPEVEEVRRTLEPHVLGVKVAAVDVRRPDFVTPRRAPLARLVGHAVTRTRRHGKKLFLITDDGQTLLIHLGMSGRVDVVNAGTHVEKHTHIIFSLSGGMEVRLRDPRRFGGMWYYATEDDAVRAELSDMGKDALEVTPQDFAHWTAARGRLKQRLLSQRDVAGLGNIYVDEALFMSQLHPLQRVDRITPQQLAALVQAIGEVLRKSIASGGTTLRDYRNVSDQPGAFARQLQAYGRSGLPCGRCGALMKSILVAARTTVFCPVCQKRR